jgi:dihydrofolate synthase/folylpolyglutamate synthase
MISRPAQSYLDAFINHEIHLGQVKSSDFKLDRVRRLLHDLGDPHKDLKIIHVAGSKGKGSICALTAHILKCAGYCVGFYSSPHLDHYRERIRILTRFPSGAAVPLGRSNADIFPDCISEDELDAVVGEIKPAIERVRAQKDSGALSFFEIYTVLALYWFHQKKVDFAVLETGLGGRLDATNVTESIVAAIAPISLEHTHILGDTVTQIAKEKAGIIKDRRQKVVIAPQFPEARKVLADRCREFAIDPIFVSEYATHDLFAQDMDCQIFDLSTAKTKYQRLEIPLLGKHQRDNAATSVCIVECLQGLDFAISPDAIREGCKNVFWPGRLEVIAREPLVLLDGAHNPTSAQALSKTIREIFQEKKVILILGFSKDKNIEWICRELSGIAKQTIFTKADHPRAADLPGARNVKDALDLAYQTARPQDVILVTGSIFIIGEARRYIVKREVIENRK